MTNNNIKISSAFFVLFLLNACTQEIPKCSDETTLGLVKQIILGQLKGIQGLTKKELEENLKFDFPRASAFDESIKKYSCQAKLLAGKYELPITYESQLDDKNQHIVFVNNIVESDLVFVKQELTESIEKSRNPNKSISTKVKSDASCLKYEPNKVKIAGILKKLTFPGAPNFESIENGDASETGFYVELFKPICTVEDESSMSLENIKLVQLVLDNDGYSLLRPSLDRNVTLEGNLFASDNGHHHAPVLLEKITKLQ